MPQRPANGSAHGSAHGSGNGPGNRLFPGGGALVAVVRRPSRYRGNGDFVGGELRALSGPAGAPRRPTELAASAAGDRPLPGREDCAPAPPEGSSAKCRRCVPPSPGREDCAPAPPEGSFSTRLLPADEDRLPPRRRRCAVGSLSFRFADRDFDLDLDPDLDTDLAASGVAAAHRPARDQRNLVPGRLARNEEGRPTPIPVPIPIPVRRGEFHASVRPRVGPGRPE